MNRNSPPYRVALVYGPQLDVGGVEKHLLQLLKYIDRERFEPVVFSSASNLFASQVSAQNSQVIPWKIKHVFDLRAMRNLKKLLQKFDIDLLHIHHPRAYWSASWAARALGIPSIVTVHLSARQMAAAPLPFRSLKVRAYTAFESWLLRQRMDRAIFVSERTSSMMKPIPKAVTIPNGIELQHITQPDTRKSIRATLQTSEECVVFVAVGRLHSQKGYDVLLNALALLQPAPEALQLWIAGEGQERAALAHQIRALHLQDVVRLLGVRDDVSELLQAADIFILPSRFEGMSFALLEAMAVGVAVISSDAGEAGNLIEDGVNGVLVSAGDPACLAEGMKTLQENPALRAALGKAAKASAADFEISPLMKRLVSVYTEVLQSDFAKDMGAPHD